MTAPPCVYCDSTDTAAYDIDLELWHVECASCGCAFSCSAVTDPTGNDGNAPAETRPIGANDSRIQPKGEQ